MALATVIDRVAIERNVVALTFDDGPGEWTPPILDLLRDAGVRATFFVIGESIEGREDILKRTADEGHEIGNHAYRHLNFPIEQVAIPDICDELIRTTDAIESVIGAPPRVFRPPGFGWNEDVRVAAAACGFDYVVNASVWTDDWNRNSAEPIIEAILSHPELAPGAIIDLHDGRPLRETDSWPDRRATVDAVKAIAPQLLDRGFEFATVSDLFALS